MRNTIMLSQLFSFLCGLLCTQYIAGAYQSRTEKPFFTVNVKKEETHTGTHVIVILQLGINLGWNFGNNGHPCQLYTNTIIVELVNNPTLNPENSFIKKKIGIVKYGTPT